ncbi:hypothetical protein E2542_SST07869 [Spatholobus suberectus]|nr:hypothetical protein E2542_SST07869 [Spatholobus suberectus]
MAYSLLGFFPHINNTLRSLAQNREVARKSRLRKKSLAMDCSSVGTLEDQAEPLDVKDVILATYNCRVHLLHFETIDVPEHSIVIGNNKDKPRPANMEGTMTYGSNFTYL